MVASCAQCCVTLLAFLTPISTWNMPIRLQTPKGQSLYLKLLLFYFPKISGLVPCVKHQYISDHWLNSRTWNCRGSDRGMGEVSRAVSPAPSGRKSSVTPERGTLTPHRKRMTCPYSLGLVSLLISSDWPFSPSATHPTPSSCPFDLTREQSDLKEIHKHGYHIYSRKEHAGSKGMPRRIPNSLIAPFWIGAGTRNTWGSPVLSKMSVILWPLIRNTYTWSPSLLWHRTPKTFGSCLWLHEWGDFWKAPKGGGLLTEESTMWFHGWNFQSHPRTSRQRRSAREWVQSPMANDLTSRACVMRPP